MTVRPSKMFDAKTYFIRLLQQVLPFSTSSIYLLFCALDVTLYHFLASSKLEQNKHILCHLGKNRKGCEGDNCTLASSSLCRACGEVMSVSQAIRYAAPTKTALGALYITCHVKPNARQGSGILSVDEDVIELAVSAQAKEGEANKAVVGLLASILKVAKSDVEVVRGMKSREKTIKVDASSLSSRIEKGNSKGEGSDVGSAIIDSVQALLQKEVDEG